MNKNALALFEENDFVTPEKIRKYDLNDLDSEYKINLEFLEDELGELAKGVRKYSTEKGLKRDGKKLDAVIDLNYIEHSNGYRQITDYEITMDEEIEKDEGAKVQAYSHETTHRMKYPHDPEANVEFLTGVYLKDLSKNAKDAGVRYLAKKGFESWKKRQRSDTSLMTDLYKTKKDLSDYAIRFQKDSGRDTTEVVTDVAFDVVKVGENIIKSIYNNTVGAIAKNYAGVNVDISKDDSLVEYARKKTNEIKQALETPEPVKETPAAKPAKEAKSN